MKTFNLYKVQVEEIVNNSFRSYERTMDKHNLIFVNRFESEEEAEKWLKEHGDRFTNYILCPSYYLID